MYFLWEYMGEGAADRFFREMGFELYWSGMNKTQFFLEFRYFI